jgi:type I restriction enzyme, S subunit
MSDWQELELQDLFTVQNGYAFKSSQYIDFEEGALEVLKMGHIERGGGLRKEPKRSFVPREDKLERWILDEGDIVMAMTDMKDNVVILGVPALVDKNDHYVLNQRVARLKLTSPNANLIYLYNYLKWPDFLMELQSRANSGVQVNLSTDAIKTSIIALPSIEEQEAIAAVLSSLDDKIDLLHRQNKTLEALAQTLFRHWFIDGAAVDWEECSLYDAIELVGGGTPKTSVESYWNGDIYWLSGGDIAKNHKNFVVSTEKRITVEGLNNSSAKLLPQFATVISARGTVGKYCILSEPMAFSQSNYGIKPKFEGCYFFTYLLIDYSVTALQAAAYGSVFDTITTQTFKNHIIEIPTAAEIQVFEEQVKPYFRRMLLNQKQICTLEKLRDTLLPKLMSGEVRVRQN